MHTFCPRFRGEDGLTLGWGESQASLHKLSGCAHRILQVDCGDACVSVHHLLQATCLIDSAPLDGWTGKKAANARQGRFQSGAVTSRTHSLRSCCFCPRARWMGRLLLWHQLDNLGPGGPALRPRWNKRFPPSARSVRLLHQRQNPQFCSRTDLRPEAPQWTARHRVENLFIAGHQRPSATLKALQSPYSSDRQCARETIRAPSRPSCAGSCTESAILSFWR